MNSVKGPMIVLAIEAAIRGGSLALLEGDREIQSWQGLTDVSRAEDLLINIQELLYEAAIDKSEVDLIASSNGPGSFTGIRIGLATALGLNNSLGIPCRGVSLLEALAAKFSNFPKIVVAVPVGRNDICHQAFEREHGILKPVAMPRSENKESFTTFFNEDSGYDFLIQHDLYINLQLNDEHVHPIEINLAYAVGLAARNNDLASNMEPFYIQNTRIAST